MSGDAGVSEPRRYLYEIRLVLAEQSKLVRVRAPDADHARATLALQYPGWRAVHTTRWGGDDWVLAP
ncbi:MAG TPA: hypothetical protein VJ301_14520 [Propionibacteriaceae bacterium]|nr:hypothetical protein [Propionibacteriaceae bacterium]